MNCRIAFITCAFAPFTASALTIELDYTYDTNDFSAGGGTVGFFASNATAKTALEAAAFDLGRSITGNLAAINLAAGDSISGSSNGTSVSYNPKWTFTDPTANTTVTLDGLNLASNTFRIYVGSQKLAGATLGQGGHGGFGYTASGTFGAASDYVTAMNTAITNTNAVTTRGSAVTIGNLGTSTFNVSGTNYTSTVALKYGPTLGNLWFDADTNNDGTLDTVAQLNSTWNFNHTTAVTAGKSDFYSVALHEMIHALGLGSSDSWNSLVGLDGNANGTKDWLGANLIALKGTGVDLVDPAGAHITEGTTGTRLTLITSALTTAGTQEVAMDPSITVGTRKVLTDVDQAFLQDMGYATTAIPEPSTLGLCSAAALTLAITRRHRRKA